MMNFKNLQKFSVVQMKNISARHLRTVHFSHPDPLVSRTSGYTTTETVWGRSVPFFLLHQELGGPEVRYVRRNCRELNPLGRFYNLTERESPKQLSLKIGHKCRKYTQIRSYSSLIEKIMKFFGRSSVPKEKQVAKEEDPVQPLRNVKMQMTPQQPEPPPQEVKVKKEPVFDDHVEHITNKFDIEAKEKPPFKSDEGKFVEDRMCSEMPLVKEEKKRKEQEEKEQDRMEEACRKEKIKTVRCSDVSKKMACVDDNPCRKDDTYLGCIQDDTYSGVAPDDDDKIIQTLQCKDSARRRKKAMQGCNPEYVAEMVTLPKEEDDCVDGGEYEREKQALIESKMKSCAVKRTINIPKKCRKETAMEAKCPAVDDCDLVKCSKKLRTTKRESRTSAREEIELMKTFESIYPLFRYGILKRDPIDIVEKKDPFMVVEVKDPCRTHAVRDPAEKDSIKEPGTVTRVLTKEEEEDDVKKGECGKMEVPPKKEPCGPKKKEPLKCKKPKEEKREEKECPPVPEKCEKRKKEICAEESTREDPCEPKPKPLCCYSPKKVEPFLTDECSKKCSVTSKQKPPVFDCAFCKKYEIIEIPTPKPKPMTCKLTKCNEKKQQCPNPQSPPPNCCQPLPKRPEFCPKCPKPKFPEEPPATPKKPKRLSGCYKKPCMQEKCTKKPKKVETKCVPDPPKPKSKPEDPCPKMPCKKESAPKPPTKLDKAKLKEKEKMCTPKKKRKYEQCVTDSCKVKSECDMKKEKKEEPKKSEPIDHSKHSAWKAVAIKGDRISCEDQVKKVPETTTLQLNRKPKYQSPRFNRCGKKKQDPCRKSKCKEDAACHGPLGKPGSGGKKAASAVLRATKSAPTLGSSNYQISGSGDDDNRNRGRWPFPITTVKSKCNDERRKMNEKSSSRRECKF